MEEYIIGFAISLAATLVGIAIDHWFIKPRQSYSRSTHLPDQYLPQQKSSLHPKERLLSRWLSWRPSRRISKAYTFIFVILIGSASGAGMIAIITLDSEEMLPLLIVPAILGGAFLVGYFEKRFELEDESFFLRIPMAIFWGTAGGFLGPLFICGGIIIYFLFWFFGDGGGKSSIPFNYFEPPPRKPSQTQLKKQPHGYFFSCPQCDNSQHYFSWPSKIHSEIENGRPTIKILYTCPKCGYVYSE
jgi:predicted RNA-binding Zn-ribbon protein involved in translation (DUF1610 family)